MSFSLLGRGMPKGRLNFRFYSTLHLVRRSQAVHFFLVLPFQDAEM